MKNAIHWFRQDLRLSDNPALTAATKHRNVLPIYILDDENSAEHAMGAASKVWLHHSLRALNSSLNGRLSLYKGDPKNIIPDLIKRHRIDGVYWNRCYEPWRIERDAKLKELLKDTGVEVESSNGSLLWEPWTVKKDDGTPYKVFTPFYRNGCLKSQAPQEPLSAPSEMEYSHDENSLSIDELQLLPPIPWDQKMVAGWNIGEQGAQKRFHRFLEEGIENYKEGRNIPSKHFVSRLSPYLHFGEISPNQLWYAIRRVGDNANIDHFCSELGWREFAYSLLFNNPELPFKNLQPKFDNFPWAENDNALLAWQKGLTGIPMIDAGMRELWETGYMHNRVRMIVGSFLVKNLRLHWQHGERWFWDTLVDADLANNSASWQWIAGCGADAAPYFRIFNPVTQGKRFDPEGEYVRQFVPEISQLPNKFLFNPWEAPENILNDAGVEIGKNYPKPIVDLKASRNSALAAFSSLKFNGLTTE